MKEVLIWLKENHPDVYEEYMAYTKPQRDLEAKRLKEKFDAVQKWLDELEDHPRWNTQNDFRKAIQMTLDMYIETNDEFEDEDERADEVRANLWSAILALAGNHPSFPKRKGIRSEEE